MASRVREVMASRLHTVRPEDTVGEAVALMAQNRVGSVLVMEGDRLLGIFTERDTVRAISQAHDAARHEVVSWMTSDPTTVGPDTTPTRRCGRCSTAASATCLSSRTERW